MFLSVPSAKNTCYAMFMLERHSIHDFCVLYMMYFEPIVFYVTLHVPYLVVQQR